MGSSPSMGYTMDIDATNSASVLLLLFSRTQLCSTLCDPMDCGTPGFLCFTNSRSLFKLMSIELVMPFNHLILCCLLFLPLQSFPASGSFTMSQSFASGGQNIGHISFSISPSNKYSGLISFRIDWFDLGFPRDCQVSPRAPQFESISSLVLSLLYSPTLTSVHDYWKNQRFDYADLCQQSNVSAF